MMVYREFGQFKVGLGLIKKAVNILVHDKVQC